MNRGWIVLALPLVLASGCGSPGDPLSDHDGEFARRLRLGVEQLRHFLPESARAEFERCARIDREHPELLFHQARLELLPQGGKRNVEAAIALLERAVAVRPDSVKTERLLHELGPEQGAAVRRSAIERIYGQLGSFELASHAAYTAGEPEPYLRFPGESARLPRQEEYRALRTALLQLNKDGNYAPSEAVPVIERTFREFPDLALVRMSYAKKLILGVGVRVNYSDRDDLPPMSSALIFDMAQLHYEQVFDQLDPGSRLARDALYMLGHISLLMGDYDEAAASFDLLLAEPQLPDNLRRFVLGQRGLVRFKQGRHAEAIEFIERSLDGAPIGFSKQLSYRWVLHLVHEAAGTPVERRGAAFRLRPDLLQPSSPVPFAFEDVAPQKRIDKLDGLGASAWGDYDRDGDDDLFVTGADSYGALFRNDGEVFVDVSREAGLFHVNSGFSATFADYDGNGWPDLHIGRDGWSGPMPNALYRNRGDGSFVEVAEQAGIAHPGSSFVCAWSDVDRDGDIDLMVANGITGGGDTNTLYRNEGDGTFTDVTSEAGLQEPAGTKTIGIAFGDYDDDGWPDLFVSGFGTRNRLYRNKGDGTFEELAARAGVSAADHISTGYVTFFLDHDNDLDLDILRTSLAPWDDVLLALSDEFETLPAEKRKSMLRNCPKLYRNEGDGTFTEVGEQAGFVHPIGIMGSGVADLDNDGFLDVYFGTGAPALERMEPDRFYRNNGDGTFTDVTFAAGLGNIGKGHGVAFTDIDGDGDLEIYAQEGGFVHGDPFPNAFYLNRQETGNHWLHVDLEPLESNTDALDARLVLKAGGLRLLREVHNGEGFGCSNSPAVEFGLGRETRIDRLEIRWPSGVVQEFDDVPIDRRVIVREGESRIRELP